ncbi:MAG: MarR family winged helix-turn-helix transcriptional regulator [Solirubrobacteraceae bacterium]
MPRRPAPDDSPHDDTTETAREVWLIISDLVLDHGRRRDVTEATGLNFARTRVLRRIARKPLTMGEIATALGIDRPNATVLIDDLENQGLVRRTPHPTDRRAKLVEPTATGKRLAKRAEDILSTPPAQLTNLGADDLATLKRILAGPTSGNDTSENPRSRASRARPIT